MGVSCRQLSVVVVVFARATLPEVRSALGWRGKDVHWPVQQRVPSRSLMCEAARVTLLLWVSTGCLHTLRLGCLVFLCVAASGGIAAALVAGSGIVLLVRVAA